MGNVCACGSGKKPSKKNNVKHKKAAVSESNKTQPSDISESTTNIHSSEEILDDNLKHEKPRVLESNKTQPSDVSESITNIHLSEEILDDNFKTQITEAIDEYMTSVPTTYQTQHDRIVNAMKSAAPERYLGLHLSDYPKVNGRTVNEMARRIATSGETKQQLIDQIDQRIESSFQLRTTDWNASSRETVRPVIKAFIQKLVNEAFDRVQLP